MDLETAPADAVARTLSGIGPYLLTRDAGALAAFLGTVFGLLAHRVSRDFALVAHGGGFLQPHGHGTFAAHPPHAFLPEGGPAGASVQVYLFAVDPDTAAARAGAAGIAVLEAPCDKPHGLREATVVSPEGFAFTAAVPLPAV
jgi:predicted enzyme related to lactoylglutathione lyase